MASLAERPDNESVAVDGDLPGHRFAALRCGEDALFRGDLEGAERVLLVVPEMDTAGSRKRLEHELSLGQELDSAWAARPVRLARYHDRTALVLQDPGGEPLDRLIGEPLDTTSFLRIAIALTAAIRGVHEQGLIHRDVKPANILLDTEGHRAWLTGFGIASRLAREHQAPEPPDVIAGTLAYMAPEQTGRMNRATDSRAGLEYRNEAARQGGGGSVPDGRGPGSGPPDMSCRP
jgi:serine/threonine protein kinase